MKKILLCWFVIGFSNIAMADSQTEITHLLSFVEQSDCIYDRNGSEHTGAEARAHIQKKYDYYRDDVETAEDFIAYSATKSMISGKKYRVLCPEQSPQSSADWLLTELKKYRVANPNIKK